MILETLALSLLLHLSPAASPCLAQQDKKLELSENELTALKKQRDLADAFMRKACQQALENLDKAAKDDKTGKDKSAKVKAAKQLLQKQLEQKRYFGTGTQLEELVAFEGWLKVADKAGIKLSDEALAELIKTPLLYQVDDKGLKKIAEEVGKQGNVTAESVLQSVAAEFRARIARDLKTKGK